MNTHFPIYILRKLECVTLAKLRIAACMNHLYMYAVLFMCIHVIQDVAQLRKDVNFAQHVLRADYESKLNHRATEL